MLGVPSFSKPTFLGKLAASPRFHQAIRTLRLLDLASGVLGKLPLRRTLDASGVEYRVRYVESLLMADEIFKREIYREAFEGRKVETFIDLGSNVGYFTCYAAHVTNSRSLIGLAVDANPKMAAETAYHVAHNELRNVKAISGLVGYPADVKDATFYVNPSNISCSALPTLNPNVPAKGDPRPVTVPTVDLAAAWREHAGDRRVDLIKIDVEGFEREVLRTMPGILAVTDAVVIEWHKWVTPREEIDALLAGSGLALDHVVAEDPHCGVAFYRRRG
jgi:FkbM family methyltransferase